MSPTLETTLRLDMASVHASCGFDSPSPYPPSSPSTELSDSEDLPRLSKTRLRSSIAELPETKLRSILFKLASSSPRFERAIRKELVESKDSLPLTPTSPKPRKAHRHKRRRSSKDTHAATQEEPLTQLSPSSPAQAQSEFLYHPGQLDREVYEFMPHAPQRDSSFTDMRLVTMWSCCDEDEWSPGCMVLSPFLQPYIQDHYESEHEPSHPDVLPDSDLERR